VNVNVIYLPFVLCNKHSIRIFRTLCRYSYMTSNNRHFIVVVMTATDWLSHRVTKFT